MRAEAQLVELSGVALSAAVNACALAQGVSLNCWLKGENAIKMDDLGVPLLQETSKCCRFTLDE